MGPTIAIAFGDADRAHQMVDHSLVAPMPDFEETTGGAEVFHRFLPGVRSDITSRSCNVPLQIVNIHLLGNHPIPRKMADSGQLIWAYAAPTLLPYG